MNKMPTARIKLYGTNLEKLNTVIENRNTKPHTKQPAINKE
jgi:hypothetical protein